MAAFRAYRENTFATNTRRPHPSTDIAIVYSCEMGIWPSEFGTSGSCHFEINTNYFGSCFGNQSGYILLERGIL